MSENFENRRYEKSSNAALLNEAGARIVRPIEDRSDSNAPRITCGAVLRRTECSRGANREMN